MTAGEAGGLPGLEDSVGCLLVVSGYDDISSALRSITEEAVSRINVSPELGDFFEVRFVGLGQRPARDAGHGEAVARLADALTRPAGLAARHYFALLAADRSAAVVGQLLSECGVHPVIGRLPIRCRGVASTEDRLPGPEKPDSRDDAGESRFAEILVAATGAWRRAGLVHEVQRFARQLLPDFASGTEAGLTTAQLGQLQPGAGDETAELTPHDELSPVPEEDATRHDLPAPSRAQREVASPGRQLALPPPPPLTSSPGGPPPGRRGAGRVRDLWRPARRGTRHAARAAHELEREALPSLLVFLALVGDEGMGDWATWRRGRSVLLEIDDKLATTGRAAYRIRALRSAGDAGMTEPREAGHLARHDIGRPAGILDFPRVLNIARTAVRREVTVNGAEGGPVPRPAVVFFAAGAPLADAVTTGIYGELTSEAAVTWIVPERLETLLSPRFEEGGARKLTDHPAVANELISRLSAGGRRDEDE